MHSFVCDISSLIFKVQGTKQVFASYVLTIKQLLPLHAEIRLSSETSQNIGSTQHRNCQSRKQDNSLCLPNVSVEAQIASSSARVVGS